MKILKALLPTLLLMLNAILAGAQVTVTKDVDFIADSVYDNDKDLLDIYMPQGKKNVPVFVYFHGGGLLGGEKNAGAAIGHKVAEQGIGLVSCNYRLSPEFQHPAHVNDAAAATAWVIKNIAKYGGNPNKVYVGGHSAGAYLAALVAIDASLLQMHEIANTQVGRRGTYKSVSLCGRDRKRPYRTGFDPSNDLGDSPDRLGASLGNTPYFTPSR